MGLRVPNFDLAIVFMTCRAKSYVNEQADTEGGRGMQISAINPPLNSEKILSFLAPPKSESKRGEMATPIPRDMGKRGHVLTLSS